MQVVLSVTLSSLYCMLGNFHMSTDILVQNVYYFSNFYPCSTGMKLACEITLTVW